MYILELGLHSPKNMEGHFKMEERDCERNFLIQLHFICIAPNLNIHFLNALYIEGQNLKKY